MIRCIFLPVLLTLCSVYAYAQKSPEDYMRDASEKQYFKVQPTEKQMREHEAAAMLDYRYIVEQHPKNALCVTAYLGIAQIYERQHREADAIAAYRQVIAMAINTKPQKPGFNFTSEGNGAALKLCDYQEKKGNYDSAIYFLAMSDTVLCMFYGCGNAAISAHEETVIRYADIYLAANRVRDAEIALILNCEHDFFNEGTRVLEKLRGVFKKQEQPENLKSEMEKAVDHYSLDTVFRVVNRRRDTLVYYNISFLGAKIRSYYRRDRGNITSGNKDGSGGMPEREQVIAYLENSDLYKMVQGL